MADGEREETREHHRDERQLTAERKLQEALERQRQFWGLCARCGQQREMKREECVVQGDRRDYRVLWCPACGVEHDWFWTYAGFRREADARVSSKQALSATQSR